MSILRSQPPRKGEDDCCVLTSRAARIACTPAILLCHAPANQRLSPLIFLTSPCCWYSLGHRYCAFIPQSPATNYSAAEDESISLSRRINAGYKLPNTYRSAPSPLTHEKTLCPPHNPFLSIHDRRSSILTFDAAGPGSGPLFVASSPLPRSRWMRTGCCRA